MMTTIVSIHWLGGLEVSIDSTWAIVNIHDIRNSSTLKVDAIGDARYWQ